MGVNYHLSKWCIGATLAIVTDRFWYIFDAHRYILYNNLGSGTYGTVKLGVDSITSESYVSEHHYNFSIFSIEEEVASYMWLGFEFQLLTNMQTCFLLQYCFRTYTC